MSKNINVNPDHYKVAGRERQGEDVVNREHKQKFGNLQSDLAARAEQRNQSIEAMRQRQEKDARETASEAAAQRRGKKKAAKKPAAESAPSERDAKGSEARRRSPRPATVRRTASSGVTKVGGSRLARSASRRASKATKKTKRAAGSVAAAASAVATTVAAKTKKAVKPRPKQALPRKPGKSAKAGPALKRAAKKRSAPARKK